MIVSTRTDEGEGGLDAIGELFGGGGAPEVQAAIAGAFLLVATILCARLGRRGGWLAAPWGLALIIAVAILFRHGVNLAGGVPRDDALVAFAHGANVAFLLTIVALSLFGGSV